MQNINTNTSTDKNQNSKERAEKLHRKIKETWTGLSDNDIKLYDQKRNEFFAKLEEKEKVSKQDAQQKLQQLEKECGCNKAKAA